MTVGHRVDRKGSGERLPALVRMLVGQCITRLSRAFYEYRGEPSWDDGLLEIRTGKGVVVLDASSDGESLRAEAGAWVDPFANVDPEENRRYVEEFGRWKRVDCSAERNYSEMIGRQITEATPLLNEFGAVAGVRLDVCGRAMWFVVEWDECYVLWALPSGFAEAHE